jgi:hypothetical protein
MLPRRCSAMLPHCLHRRYGHRAHLQLQQQPMFIGTQIMYPLLPVSSSASAGPLPALLLCRPPDVLLSCRAVPPPCCSAAPPPAAERCAHWAHLATMVSRGESRNVTQYSKRENVKTWLTRITYMRATTMRFAMPLIFLFRHLTCSQGNISFQKRKLEPVSACLCSFVSLRGSCAIGSRTSKLRRPAAGVRTSGCFTTRCASPLPPGRLVDRTAPRATASAVAWPMAFKMRGALRQPWRDS